MSSKNKKNEEKMFKIISSLLLLFNIFMNIV